MPFFSNISRSQLNKLDTVKYSSQYNKISNLGRLVDGVTAAAIWKVLGTPDVLLGILPIYTVQRYEVARSHDKMKYRAVAGQFFAHQRGGNVAFKTVLYLVGDSMINTLTIIQFLHALGDASYSDLNDLIKNPVKGIQKLITNQAANPAGAVAQLPAGGTSRKSFNPNDKSWHKTEEHFTFAIVTREEILHDMYIETVLYERDVSMGDALKVTLLCRKYIPPARVAALELFDTDGAILDVGVAHNQVGSNGTFKSKVKSINVVYVASNTSKSNLWGLLEQHMFRAYVRFIGDRQTDLQLIRSETNRINGNAYLKIGLDFNSGAFDLISDYVYKIIPPEINFNKSKVIEVEQAKNNTEINNALFINQDGRSVILETPDNAVLLKTIKQNERANVFIDTPVGRYVSQVFYKNDGVFHYSNLTKRFTLPLVNNSTVSCFIEKDGIYLLMYKIGNKYNLYRYNGKVINWGNW